jgi:DNA-binding transcriptional LysR family regulator
MELKRLRAFVATAETTSFRQAAERLRTQISSVSRTVAALEDELGVSLFDRSTRGVRLTMVGQAFLIDARRILADVDRARKGAQSAAAGVTGRLRLAVCEDATTPVFARILAAFRSGFPEVALDLFELPSAMQLVALSRGEIDAGLLLPPVQASEIEAEELWCDPWAVACSSDHVLSERESIAIADLAQHDFITAHPEFGPGCHAQSMALFASAGTSPNIVARAFHRQTMLALVQSGAGVTLVPGSFVDMRINGLCFRPLQTDDPGLCVAAAFRKGDLPGVVAQFLRAARAVVPS